MVVVEVMALGGLAAVVVAATVPHIRSAAVLHLQHLRCHALLAIAAAAQEAKEPGW
jgi:hypothetical protein